MRTCRKCGVGKPLEQFPIAIPAKGYRRHRCDDCTKSYHRAFYAAGRKKFIDRSSYAYHAKLKAWRKTPEGIVYRRAQHARLNRKYRAQVLEFYGRECACCGETNDRFLTIDHVNNDGKDQRKEHKSGASFYRWLIRNNFPAGFQVLCFNCNIGRALNGGTCPHKEGSTTMAKASTAKRPEAPSPSI